MINRIDVKVWLTLRSPEYQRQSSSTSPCGLVMSKDELLEEGKMFGRSPIAG